MHRPFHGQLQRDPECLEEDRTSIVARNTGPWIGAGFIILCLGVGIGILVRRGIFRVHSTFGGVVAVSIVSLSAIYHFYRPRQKRKRQIAVFESQQHSHQLDVDWLKAKVDEGPPVGSLADSASNQQLDVEDDNETTINLSSETSTTASTMTSESHPNTKKRQLDNIIDIKHAVVMEDEKTKGSLKQIRSQNSVLDICGSGSSESDDIDSRDGKRGEQQNPTTTPNTSSLKMIVHNRKATPNEMPSHDSSSFSSSDDGVPLNPTGYISFISESSTRSGGRTGSIHSVHSLPKVVEEMGEENERNGEGSVIDESISNGFRVNGASGHRRELAEAESTQSSDMEVTIDTSLTTMIQDTVTQMEESSRRMRRTIQALNSMTSAAAPVVTAPDIPPPPLVKPQLDGIPSNQSSVMSLENVKLSQTTDHCQALKRMTEPIMEVDEDGDDNLEDFEDARDDQPLAYYYSSLFSSQSRDAGPDMLIPSEQNVFCNQGGKASAGLSTIMQSFQTPEPVQPVISLDSSCPEDEKIQDTTEKQQVFVAALESFGVDNQAILKVAEDMEHSFQSLGKAMATQR